MSPADFRIKVLNVPERFLENWNIESFLFKHGYDLNKISWMAIPLDAINVMFQEQSIDENTGAEQHMMRDSRLKNFSIYESVQEVKNREQKELVKAVCTYGEKVDDGYDYNFKDECPIVAAYDGDEPCDVIVLHAKVSNDDTLSLIIDLKDNRGNEHELNPDEVFAGHIEFITAAVKD